VLDLSDKLFSADSRRRSRRRTVFHSTRLALQLSKLQHPEGNRPATKEQYFARPVAMTNKDAHSDSARSRCPHRVMLRCAWQVQFSTAGYRDSHRAPGGYQVPTLSPCDWRMGRRMRFPAGAKCRSARATRRPAILQMSPRVRNLLLPISTTKKIVHQQPERLAGS
jgi:hypothetical protein